MWSRKLRLLPHTSLVSTSLSPAQPPTANAHTTVPQRTTHTQHALGLLEVRGAGWASGRIHTEVQHRVSSWQGGACPAGRCVCRRAAGSGLCRAEGRA